MRRQSFAVVSASTLPCLLSHDSPRLEDASPAESHTGRRQYPLAGSPTLSAFSGSHALSGTTIQTSDEARFFTYYIRHLSHWVDICDQRCHFATEVPRRALQQPLLAYSLKAVASRQLSLVSSIGDIDPAAYYSQALTILISKLSGPVEGLDENILAALVLLRTYEEITGRLGSMSVRDAMSFEQQQGDDTGTHLSGVTQLLNSVANFMGKGGLGEAASWIVLRQDMYFSLTRSHPMRIHLDSYAKANAFTDDSAESIANRIIFICARIQACAFDTSGRATITQWNQLRADVDDWFNSKPWGIRPMWVDAIEDGHALPRAWLHHPAYVVAYQQYYLSLMLLAVFDPELWNPGFNSFQKRRQADEIVLENLRLVIGLSICHPSVMPARFLASHILQTCGTYLNDPMEQQETLQLLQDTEVQCGWRTKPTVDKLISSWSGS
ncbi:putative Transcription factor domain-containing protein [Seiridium cardinale]